MPPNNLVEREAALILAIDAYRDAVHRHPRVRTALASTKNASREFKTEARALYLRVVDEVETTDPRIAELRLTVEARRHEIETLRELTASRPSASCPVAKELENQ